jgi:hypothetical protein
MDSYTVLTGIVVLAAVAIYGIVQIRALSRRLDRAVEITNVEERIPYSEVLSAEIEAAQREGRDVDIERLLPLPVEGFENRLRAPNRWGAVSQSAAATTESVTRTRNVFPERILGSSAFAVISQISESRTAMSPSPLTSK